MCPPSTRGSNDEILSVDDPAAPGNSLTTNVDSTIHAGLEALVGMSIAAGGGRIEPLLSVTRERVLVRLR